MNIRKSTPADLDAMLDLYAQAREFMAKSGNPTQWINGYPLPELLLDDIAQGSSYVCEDNGTIVGTFMYFEGDEPTYAEIYEGQWLSDNSYGVVHRITAKVGSRGVATYCLNWCFDQCGNVRIDTHKNNAPMKSLLKKLGYVYCGIIYVEDHDERIAFQKTSVG